MTFNKFVLQPRGWFCSVDQVLKLITSQPCPQQTNGVDCGLLAVEVSIHILEGVEVTRDTFSQGHIIKFQQMLPSLLTQKKKELFC